MEQRMRLLKAEEISEGWNIPVSVIYQAWRTGDLKAFIPRGNVRGKRATAEWVNDWINNMSQGGNHA